MILGFLCGPADFQLRVAAAHTQVAPMLPGAHRVRWDAAVAQTRDRDPIAKRVGAEAMVRILLECIQDPSAS